MAGITSGIHWDYIRRKIETESDIAEQIELLPVSAKFFKKHQPTGTQINSLLAGPGGKASGFALATVKAGSIALASVRMRVNRAAGAKLATRTSAAVLANMIESENKQMAEAIRKTGGVPPSIGNGNGPKA